MANKFEKNFTRKEERKSKNYGDTIVEFDVEKKEKKEKKEKNFGGEYVDYEELEEK
tara:strand:- start:756 stop:923 length:168 start_codon:yes stop_codon:yes gene_type:complete